MRPVSNYLIDNPGSLKMSNKSPIFPMGVVQDHCSGHLDCQREQTGSASLWKWPSTIRTVVSGLGVHGGQSLDASVHSIPGCSFWGVVTGVLWRCPPDSGVCEFTMEK